MTGTEVAAPVTVDMPEQVQEPEKTDEVQVLGGNRSDESTFPRAFTPGRAARAPSMPNGLLGPDHGADSIVDGGRVLGGVVRAASVRGNRHRWEDEPRQDAMHVARVDSDFGAFAVLAVADGVGSAKYAHVGSTAAVRAAVDAVQRNLRGEDDLETAGASRLVAALTRGASAAAEAVSHEGEGLNVEATELATTLCLAVLAESEAGAVHAQICTVGDSGFRILRQGAFESAVETTLIRDTATAALPHSTDPMHHDVELQAGDALLLATDGLLDPLVDTERSARFAEQLALSPQYGLAHFLWVIDASVRSYDDDRTAACFWVGEP